MLAGQRGRAQRTDAIERLQMKVISVEEMRNADAYTIANYIPSKELMRRAAQGVYDAYQDGWSGQKTLIICGSGNNGGDGYALAQIMKSDGHDVTVLRVSGKFSEDGQFYYEKCLAAGIRVLAVNEDEVNWKAYDIFVDCIFGTGFKGVPRDPAAGVIAAVNREREERGAFVISVDINSGMNGDTGEAEIAVASDLTVSIGYYKHGLFRGRAHELIGRLENVDIGIIFPEE